MENLIELHTQKEKGISTDLIIDNSTEFKDFHLQQQRGSREINVFIYNNNEGVSINGVTLSGLELQLLKEFLNQ